MVAAIGETRNGFQVEATVCCHCGTTRKGSRDRLGHSTLDAECRKCGTAFDGKRLLIHHGLKRVALRCEECGGSGVGIARGRSSGVPPADCEACGGSGFEGIDPTEPTDAMPGSTEKILILAARYGAGQPLWRAGDKTTQAPHIGDLDSSSDGDGLPVFAGSIGLQDDEFDDED